MYSFIIYSLPMKTLLQAKSFDLVIKDRNTGRIKKEFTDSTQFQFIFKVMDSIYEIAPDNFKTYLYKDCNKIKDVDLQTACNETFNNELISISFN